MNKVVELVNVWARMEADSPDMDITEFCVRYLAEQAPVAETPAPGSMAVEDQLSGHLGRMSRYAQLYARKAMQGLPLNNVDDAVYLIALSTMGTPKKSELIHHMLSEFPSGIEVIKRLINLGYVEEFPDDEDRRSKRVRMTDRGREVLAACYPVMSRAGSIVFARLLPEEKTTLLRLLIKLDRFHADHYKMARSEDFEEIYRHLYH